MAFRLRRGTDAERLLITPAEGELIYTTDIISMNIGKLSLNAPIGTEAS